MVGHDALLCWHVLATVPGQPTSAGPANEAVCHGDATGVRLRRCGRSDRLEAIAAARIAPASETNERTRPMNDTTRLASMAAEDGGDRAHRLIAQAGPLLGSGIPPD